jgi:phospholipid/cholesterol/gamma-HCH transport system substrate-binding protein
MSAPRRRNPVVTGAVGILVIALATAAAFFSEDLPIVGGGTTYTAEFSEAAGLTTGDEVRVAGVRAGKVTSVSLDGNKVAVAFRVNGTWVGDQSTAAIRIKTLLGSKYVSLDPQGVQAADPGTPIPLDRTVAPYDVIEAFSGLATTVGSIDTGQLASSLTTLSDAFSATPADVRTSLDGLTRLSQTISSRDQQLTTLLSNTDQVTQVLADRNTEFERLLQDGNLLLGELNTRRQAISQLLTNTRALSTQLSGLVADNQAQLGPTLAQLQGVVDILKTNQSQLDSGLALLAPFYRLFANTLGNGRWFDTTVTNLLPPGLPNVLSGRAPILNGG